MIDLAKLAISKDDQALLLQIVKRIGVLGGAAYAHSSIKNLRLAKVMDSLDACHALACPLRLAELLKADDSYFVHDVLGISKHLSLATGKLAGGFLPHFAR